MFSSAITGHLNGAFFMAEFSIIGKFKPTDTTLELGVDEKFNFEMHTGSGALDTDEFKDGYVFWIGAGCDESNFIGGVRFSLQEAIYLHKLLGAGIKQAVKRLV